MIEDPRQNVIETLIPKVYVVFRENSFYTKDFSAKIESMLKGCGRAVYVHTFPANATQEDIKQWIRENKSGLEGTSLLGDNTFINSLYSVKDINGNLFTETTYLDSFVDSAVIKTVVPGEVTKDDLEGPFDAAGDALFKKAALAILAEIFQKPENIPQQIYIIPAKLKDHQQYVSPSAEPSAINDPNILIAENWKKWFVEANVPGGRINVVQTGVNYLGAVDEDDYNELLKTADNQGSWIILDRHNIATRTGELSAPKNAVRLRLPLVNFITDANNAGLLDIKTEAILNDIEAKLKQKYKQETK